MERPKGRPTCKKACCSDGAELKRLYLEERLSVDKIAKIIHVSKKHIRECLTALSIKRRVRSDYPPSRGGGMKRKSLIWKAPLYALFDASIDTVAQRFNVCRSTVVKARRVRREEAWDESLR